MDQKTEKSFPDWLPFVLGGLLVVQFAGLGAWQVTRGLEKQAEKDLFADESGFAAWSDGMEVRSYLRIRVAGAFDTRRQFLLDNIILESRLGYYVITPLETAAEEPLLLVNRGWIARSDSGGETPDITVDAGGVTVKGRIGSLPRAGYRMGDAILPDSAWPKRAVYPDFDDLSRELGRALQPFVLLMDPQDANGFLRHWVPEEMGPGRHFAYALQWFAMAAVLSVLLIWNYRRRRQRRD